MKKRMHGNTGCDILDAAGIKEGQGDRGSKICLYHCPYAQCKLNRNKPDTEGPKVEKEEEYEIQEVSVVCQSCRTMETVEFINGVFGRHSRFLAKGNNIYHLKLDGSICGQCNGVKDRGSK